MANRICKKWKRAWFGGDVPSKWVKSKTRETCLMTKEKVYGCFIMRTVKNVSLLGCRMVLLLMRDQEPTRTVRRFPIR